jgi:PKHD-type hydroxylase
MSRNIDVYVPPMEQYVIWSGGFTGEECDLIKQTGELSEFMDAAVGRGVDNKVDEDVRKTKIVWIEPQEENKWIFERMNELTAKINFDKFQMKLRQFDGFQYSKYAIDNFYDWHTDTIINPENGLYRKLSFSLMLSDPSEFEGGEFLISPHGSESKSETISLNKGDVVVFYSHIPHKVSPVTKGERISLVTWALGDKLK